MFQTMWATIRSGQVQLSENVQLPEGTKLLVTILPEREDEFWLSASESSLGAVWDNVEDDAYAQLLED